MHIGGNIQKARKGNGLGQGDLARRISVTMQTVSRWERGQREPKATEIAAIAQVLEIPVSTLFEGLVEGEGVFQENLKNHAGTKELFSKNLVKRRASTGKKQKEIALAVGISPGYYSQIEKGIREPSLHIVVQIAEILGCSLEALLIDERQKTGNSYPSVGDDIRNWIT